MVPDGNQRSSYIQWADLRTLMHQMGFDDSVKAGRFVPSENLRTTQVSHPPERSESSAKFVLNRDLRAK